MEWADYMRFVLSLGFVLGLIGLCAAGVKRFGLLPGMSAMSSRTKERRIKIIETLPIDTKNRVVLLRFDNQEHLLLIGPESGSVIEAGMKPSNHIRETPEPALPSRFPGIVDLFTVARP